MNREPFSLEEAMQHIRQWLSMPGSLATDERLAQMFRDFRSLGVTPEGVDAAKAALLEAGHIRVQYVLTDDGRNEMYRIEREMSVRYPAPTPIKKAKKP